MKSIAENKFTSTTTKLLHNFDRFSEIQQGILRPISIQLAPTDKCNLNCSFCSVKEREQNELSLDECKKILQDFKSLGAKTVEITGGGDPTMYYAINDLISFSDLLGYKIGLITNGVLLNNKIDKSILQKLTWIRISLNCLDYVSEIFPEIPENVVLGFSYVWNDRSTYELLPVLQEYKLKFKAKYVRVVPDCLDVEKIKQFKLQIKEKLEEYPEFFLQEKEYSVPSSCCIGYIKPYVNSDGYVYHCSAVPLIRRKFTEEFRMCQFNDIISHWQAFSKQNLFNTQYCQEGKCFFKEHNELLQQLMLEVEHKDFI